MMALDRIGYVPRTPQLTLVPPLGSLLRKAPLKHLAIGKGQPAQERQEIGVIDRAAPLACIRI